MFPIAVSLLFLQKKGLTIRSHPKQITITTQIHKINNINFQSNCTHVAFSPHLSFIVYKIKDMSIIPETLTTFYKFHLKNKTTRNFMRQSNMTHGLHFHLLISSLPLCSYKQKQPQTVGKTFSISHMALLSNWLPP